jgi:hypothetical protein
VAKLLCCEALSGKALTGAEVEQGCSALELVQARARGGGAAASWYAGAQLLAMQEAGQAGAVPALLGGTGVNLEC